MKYCSLGFYLKKKNISSISITVIIIIIYIFIQSWLFAYR